MCKKLCKLNKHMYRLTEELIMGKCNILENNNIAKLYCLNCLNPLFDIIGKRFFVSVNLFNIGRNCSGCRIFNNYTLSHLTVKFKHTQKKF